MKRLKRVSVKAPRAPTISEPAANMVNMGTQNVEKNSKVDARVRANMPKVAIFTGMIINAVTGEALPS
jgi:hypothetical protein